MKNIIVLLFLIFSLAGCSSKVLLPYEEESLCDNCEVNAGYCGSVSDVYNYVLDKEKGINDAK